MNLVTLFEEDRLKKFMVDSHAFYNKDSDYDVGDRVVVLRCIDSMIDTSVKFGMLGNIVMKKHRYKGQVAEHFEYDVKIDNVDNKPRCNTTDIIKLDQAYNILDI